MRFKMTVSKDCIKKNRERLLKDSSGKNNYVDCIVDGNLEFDEYFNEISVGGQIIKIETNKAEIKKLIECFLKGL